MTNEDVPWFFNRNDNSKAILRQLGDGIAAKIFVGKNSMLSFVTIEPHTQGSIHQHPEEQWGILLEGSCIRIQDDLEINMQEGDFWYSGPNVLHGIRTTDQAAVVLDIFSPPRPDYKTEGVGFDSS